MAKIVLDLHDIFNKGFTIDTELNRVIAEAKEKKISEMPPEIGQLELSSPAVSRSTQPYT